MKLAGLQRAFAARVLTGDDAILAHVNDSSREQRTVLMHVYEHAYGARLAEILEGDFEKLHAALGQDAPHLHEHARGLVPRGLVVLGSERVEGALVHDGEEAAIRTLAIWANTCRPFWPRHRPGGKRPGWPSWQPWNGPWAKFSWPRTRPAWR